MLLVQPADLFVSLRKEISLDSQSAWLTEGQTSSVVMCAYEKYFVA